MAYPSNTKVNNFWMNRSNFIESFFGGEILCHLEVQIVFVANVNADISLAFKFKL